MLSVFRKKASIKCTRCENRTEPRDKAFFLSEHSHGSSMVISRFCESCFKTMFAMLFRASENFAWRFTKENNIDKVLRTSEKFWLSDDYLNMQRKNIEGEKIDKN